MEQQDIRRMSVGDVMQEEWPTLGPDDTVETAIRLFAKMGISGAPVVEGGALIGILTDGDLIFRDAEIKSPGFLDILGGIVPLGDWDEYQQEILKSAGVTVREVMTEEITTVSAETSLSEAATIMANEHRKLLPVAGERKLYGVLSRMDILALHVQDPRK
ncbi:MAG: CBS domain-containing protein [Rubrobacteraceae bacterium]